MLKNYKNPIIKTIYIINFSFIILLTGCAVHENLVPTSGNRAAGTVTMSFEYGLFQKPIINPAQGEAEAQQRCGAWGYSGAEPFGGAMQTCEAFNGYGECIRRRVDIKYQCTGNLH